MTCNLCLEREAKGKGRGNSTNHFSDQYLIPYFLCKHPNILSQNKNGIIQISQERLSRKIIKE